MPSLRNDLIADIVGIDCATDPKNIGIAHAIYRGGGELPVVTALAAGGGKGEASPPEMVAQLLSPERPALIALDAPLGWPLPLGRLLSGHRAGDPVSVPPNQLFRRRTDMVVRRYLGKQPLDVGADRIARTAVAALDLLDAVRRLSGRGFGVATRGVPPGFPSARGVSEAAGGEAASAAVEVYPAGRLIAKGGSAYARGYRSSDEASRARRGQLLDDLAGELVFHTETGPAIRDVDILDAILCVAAAVDFLSGICTPPEAIGVPHEEADREGWIWLPLQDS